MVAWIYCIIFYGANGVVIPVHVVTIRPTVGPFVVTIFILLINIISYMHFILFITKCWKAYSVSSACSSRTASHLSIRSNRSRPKMIQFMKKYSVSSYIKNKLQLGYVVVVSCANGVVMPVHVVTIGPAIGPFVITVLVLCINIRYHERVLPFLSG